MPARPRRASSSPRTCSSSANLRFVVNVAKKYQNQGLPLADLISEGNIGLMNAIERFDVEKGYHFISYAVWWIRQAILKAICEKSRMIRLPLNRANELVQIEKVRKDLQGEQWLEARRPTRSRSKLDMDREHVADLLNISRELVSLETPVYSREGLLRCSATSWRTGATTAPDEHVVDELAARRTSTACSTPCPQKESEIIQYRFGLNGTRPMSLKEIGSRYKLTKERIRQIEKKALKRLQHPSRSHTLRAYM